MTTASPRTSPRPNPDRPPPRRFAQESELRARLAAYWPDLYGRALRLSRNHALAQDVLQDTFERALRFEDQYEPDSNLRAWLQRILVSVFITRCRRMRREKRALEMLTNDPCAWTLPDGPAVATSLSRNVARALGSLPSLSGARSSSWTCKTFRTGTPQTFSRFPSDRHVAVAPRSPLARRDPLPRQTFEAETARSRVISRAARSTERT